MDTNPIQKKRRAIIDRINELKSFGWDDDVKRRVGKLYDELDEIDKGITK